MIDSTIVINTTEQTASTTELHSPVISGIAVTLVSEQSTELSKGPKVVSSRFRTVEYCLPKPELLKTKAFSSHEAVSSRLQNLECCLPQNRNTEN